MSAEERCEFSDLPKDMCGCGSCKPELLPQPHVPKVVRDRMGPPKYGPWFGARFDSECDGCGGQIEEDDQIRSDGEGGWLCSDCGEQ